MRPRWNVLSVSLTWPNATAFIRTLSATGPGPAKFRISACQAGNTDSVSLTWRNLTNDAS